MTRQPPLTVLPIPALDGKMEHSPADLSRLDFLGRMPVPLRRAFKAGLDRSVAARRAAAGEELACCFLSGGEWYRPFDGLAACSGDQLPNLLATPFHYDLLFSSLLRHYAPSGEIRDQPDCHPVCASAGLSDPEGVFRLFAAIPFVFLVDETRLRGRPAPRAWEDLLNPAWAEDIVFGGWRPNDRVPYQDYNDYLLLALCREYGAAGLEAFAANVRHLQHNVRTATLAGSNSSDVGAIAILPWLQAELNPRRQRTRVIWPEDGALAMPINYLVKTGMEARVQTLVDYLTGPDLGALLAHNRYPPSNPRVADAFPAGVRLKWLGWDYVRSHDIAAESRRAAALFFTAWNRGEEIRACA
jgi:ABC-type Fe3+ transport system substrate-binding protein